MKEPMWNSYILIDRRPESGPPKKGFNQLHLIHVKMKIISFLTFSFQFIISQLIISCNNDNSGTAHKKAMDSAYSKIELYCYCLYTTTLNGHALSHDYCTTQSPLTPVDIINSDYLYDSTTDPRIIKAMTTLFFDGREKSQPLRSFTNARFVILFHRGVGIDTIVYRQNSSEFSFNERYLWTYSFNVLDTLKKILNKDQILCTPFDKPDFPHWV